MNLRLPGMALLGLALAACTHREVEDEVPVAQPQTAEQAMAELGNPLLANKGDLNAVNYSVGSSEELEKIDNGTEEELIWTNPDDPDADIPGLAEAFENKRLGNGWLIDMNQAVRLARRQERPLIVWFHDSVISPKSKELAQEYLDTKEFDAWCRDRVVRVRLDSGASLDDSTSHQAKYSFRRINALQKRYGLKKKPSLAVITPSGKIVQRLDGYDGFLATFVQELKAGVISAEREYKNYKQQYVDMGYREWHQRRGDHTVFAKVMRLDEQHDVVYLKEPGGRVSRTKLAAFREDEELYLRSLLPQKMKHMPEPEDNEQI